MIGVIISSFCGLMPGDVQLVIPYYFRFLAFMVGMLISFIGIVILYMRTLSTGSNHLIAPGRPGTVLWFFVYADGEIRILPSKRTGEGQLYNAELDSQVIDVKTYSLGDHKIRIVPEVVGHAVDLDFVLYVNLLKNRYGFENLREARAAGLKGKIKKPKEIVDKEGVLIGDENESLDEKIRRVQKQNQPRPTNA